MKERVKSEIEVTVEEPDRVQSWGRKEKKNMYSIP